MPRFARIQEWSVAFAGDQERGRETERRSMALAAGASGSGSYRPNYQGSPASGRSHQGASVTTRRGFLGAILAAAAAPAFVRYGSLMVPKSSGALLTVDDFLPVQGDLIIEDIYADGMAITDIIQTRIRARIPELIANISANNALLTRLKQSPKRYSGFEISL
jgi:hypothetical protein